MSELRARWMAVDAAERARRMVIAAVAGGALGYALLWLPLRRDVAKLEVSVPQDQKRLDVMRVQANDVSGLRAQAVGGVRAGGSSLSTIEQSADRWGIRPQMTSLNQDAANGLQVVLEGVSFNTLMTWLDDLRKKNGLRVDKASIDALSADGFVTARLVLQ